MARFFTRTEARFGAAFLIAALVAACTPQGEARNVANDTPRTTPGASRMLSVVVSPDRTARFTVAAIDSVYFGGVVLEFGDGQEAMVCLPGESCEANEITHVYAEPGPYTVRLLGLGGGAPDVLTTQSVTF